ncbi:MAG: hydroxymethylbilane synthase [Rhizobiales bacterium]|nr:hydroxymethylbilane synthase [Hyphomicrobiales bacterium]
MTKLRIGTRGSPLALAQATAVRAALGKAHRIAADDIEIVALKTTGDMERERSFAESGGKGIFTKEIDEALLSGQVDLAVHSAKDVQTILPEGLVIAAAPPRADPRDAFLSTKAKSLETLPRGAKLGTASVRRQALALRLRPDLQISLLRGNVQTRMDKMKAGECDATILAYAGLQRLGLTAHATQVLDPMRYPPAVAQGIIAIEARSDDRKTKALLSAITHAESFAALVTERAFLLALDGSCRAPIAGHAKIERGRLRFVGLVITPTGRDFAGVSHEGNIRDAERIGREAGEYLLARAPAGALTG